MIKKSFIKDFFWKKKFLS